MKKTVLANGQLARAAQNFSSCILFLLCAFTMCQYTLAFDPTIGAIYANDYLRLPLAERVRIVAFSLAAAIWIRNWFSSLEHGALALAFTLLAISLFGYPIGAGMLFTAGCFVVIMFVADHIYRALQQMK